MPWPKVPTRFGHGSAFKDWKMLGNGPDDTVEPGFQGCGDCAWAGPAHETMLTNKLAGKSVAFDGKCVVADYSAATGYVIGDDSTDQGTAVRDMLKFRRSTGVQDVHGNRHKIGAYVRLNAKDWDELMQAVYVFTCVGLGFEVPATQDFWDQFDNHEPWDVTDENASIEGGHYVPAVGRSGKTTLGAVSWARRQGMTQAFYTAYNDESWAIVFPEEPGTARPNAVTTSRSCSSSSRNCTDHDEQGRGRRRTVRRRAAAPSALRLRVDGRQAELPRLEAGPRLVREEADAQPPVRADLRGERVRALLAVRGVPLAGG